MRYVFVILAAVLVLGGGLYYYTATPQPASEVSQESAAAPTEETTTQFARFESKEMGIAFSYPKEWGEATLIKSQSTDQKCDDFEQIRSCTQYLVVTRDAGGFVTHRIMAANGVDYAPEARGPGWFDLGHTQSCASGQDCRLFDTQGGVQGTFVSNMPAPYDGTMEFYSFPPAAGDTAIRGYVSHRDQDDAVVWKRIMESVAYSK